MLLWILLFCVLAGDVYASDPISTDKARLEKDLMKEYNANERPVKNKKNAVSITTQMTPQYFTIDDDSDLITVRSFMTVNWQDEFLTWNPEDYSGVDKVQFEDQIWDPETSLYMSNYESGYWNARRPLPCDVQSNGTVTCISFVTHNSHCVPLPNQWPFEVLVCLLRFGSWTYTEEEMRLYFADPPVTMSEFQESRQWALVIPVGSEIHPDKYTVYNNSYPTKYISFIVQRKSATHAAVVVVPALAIAVITIASGLMASGGLRIGVAVSSLLVQMYYYIQIAWYIPLHGDYPKHIIKFFVDSLIMTTVTILMYVWMIAMTKLTQKPPRLVGIIIRYAKAIPAKIITFGEIDSEKSPMEGGSDEIDNKPQEEILAIQLEWRQFATICNNMFFYTITVVYIVLIITYTSNV